jgi:hypothetical protein
MKFVKRNVIFIIILLSIIIIGATLYNSRIIKEGLLMPQIPGTTYNSYTIKSKPLSASDIVIIMNEILIKIQNHDTILNNLDSSYVNKSQQLQLSSDVNQFKNNIQSMLLIMRDQDAEIKILSPSYIASPDLSGLIDGTLLADKQTLLYNLSHYPLNPMDCSLNIMKQQLADMKKTLADKVARAGPAANNAPLVDPNSQLNYEITTKESDIKTMALNLKDPNFTQCNPTMSVIDSESIYIGYQLTSMNKIVALQETAIRAVQQKMAKTVVDFYSKLPQNNAK